MGIFTVKVTPRKILLLNGPNLNLLGQREPEIYGKITLPEIEKEVKKLATTYQMTVIAKQSNHEGELIDFLQQAAQECQGVIFNPGGYTHTSVALRDCIAAIAIPVIEVHLSNTAAREEFRRHSLLAPVCQGQIIGLGWRGYLLAVYAFGL